MIELSFVLATRRLETIERGLEYLRAQTARDRLEVVVVSVSGEPLGIDAASFDGFGGHQVVEDGAPLSLAAARAAGVRASTAPFVHVGETHSFPRPDWAERLLETLGDGSAAVVSGLDNGNPVGGISWANFVIDYGAWFVGRPGGQILRIPAYNTAFERSAIGSVLAGEPEAFSPGYEIAAELHRQGRRIGLCPEAAIDHVNLSRWRGWFGQRSASGRARAAARARRWPWPRRAAYALGWPLIPLVLAARLREPFLVIRRSRRLPAGTVPLMLVSLYAQAYGEFLGFVFGARGDVVSRADGYEIDRVAYATGKA